MPLNFNPSTVSPDAIRRMLMQGGDAASMFSGDPSQQPQSAPAQAPQPSPSISQPSGPPSGQLSSATSQPSPSDAAPPVNAPIAGAPEPYQHGTLAKILLGVGQVIGNPLATRIGERDQARQREIEEYNRPGNVAALQNRANLDQQQKQSEISHTQAQTHLENVQADLAQQNLPLQEAAQKHYQQLMTTWQSKGVPDFDSYAQTYLQGLPPVMARMLAPHLAAIKQMPQTGKGYTVNMQDDMPTSVNVYGKDYDRKDPELMKLPAGPEAAADFDRALSAHQAKRGEKLEDEKTTAGYAADRQAQAFSNQQQMENTKKMQPAVDTALSADQRLARMEKSYTKGVAGDQQAQLALVADHLGMTFGLQKGAKISRGLIEGAEQSMPWLEKIGAKFDKDGYLSGVALGPQQMSHMLDLGYDARDQAWKGAHDAATTWGVPLPPGAQQVEQQRQPGSKPLLQQQGGQGGAQHTPGGQAQGLKEGATGTGSDKKKYIVKGGVWVSQ